MNPCTWCSEATANTEPQLCNKCRDRAIEDMKKQKGDVMTFVVGDLT